MAGSAQQAQVAALKASLAGDAPPAGLDGPLAALWHGAKGNFEQAMTLLAEDASAEAARVRAHLHRRRGEEAEAEHWYGKAGIEAPIDSPDAEWAQLAASLLVHI